VVVSVTGANTATPTVTDEGDGTYTASYTPTSTGDDDIAITMNGIAISGSSFTSTVGVGALDEASSTASVPTTGVVGSPTDITVQARDGSGNALGGTYSGDTVAGVTYLLLNTNPSYADEARVQVAAYAGSGDDAYVSLIAQGDNFSATNLDLSLVSVNSGLSYGYCSAARFSFHGSLGVNDGSPTSLATEVLYIGDRTGDPTTPSGGVYLYSKSGELYVKDTGGNVTQLS
jgi:hypothetical protein